jgi:hypothetical protein
MNDYRVRYGEDINDGKRVALKIVDLSRFRDDTVSLMIKEVFTYHYLIEGITL